MADNKYRLFVALQQLIGEYRVAISILKSLQKSKEETIHPKKKTKGR